MGFGVGCYANCCHSDNRYSIESVRRLGYATDSMPYQSGDPQNQWFRAVNAAYQMFSTDGEAFGTFIRGPCSDPGSWFSQVAHTSQNFILGNGSPVTLISGASRMLAGNETPWYWSGNFEEQCNPNEDLLGYGRARMNAAHSGIAASGIYNGASGINIFGFTGPMQGTESVAAAQFSTMIWLFMVPVLENESFASAYNYSMLRFLVRINQRRSSFINCPIDIAPNHAYTTYGEWNKQNEPDNWDPITGRTVDKTRFRIVVGNAAGIIGTTRPIGSFPAHYWPIKHILAGDYQEITSWDTPPDDASDEEHIIDELGLARTTSISTQQERDYLTLYPGVVWFLAIVPDGQLCMAKILTDTIPRARQTNSTDGWKLQEIASDKISLLNVVRLEGQSSRGSAIFVPNNDDIYPPIP